MIANDISYIQTTTIPEALDAWRAANDAGKRVRYFSGGTELITRARERSSEFDVLIDIKRIPECSAIDLGAGVIGAAARLSALTDQDQIPLLAAAARGIADRTARNSITFGGNICSMLPYRETLLPVLIAEAEVLVAGPSAPEPVARPITELFERRLRLGPGEMLVAVRAPALVGLEGYYSRRTRDARVDYPIVSVAMARVADELRLAVGGACGYPVRSRAAEESLTGSPLKTAWRGQAISATDSIPDRIWDDMRASADYRRELLVQAIEDGLALLGEGAGRE